MKKVSVVIIVAVLALTARAELTLPGAISDGMVVQRGQPVRFWGRGDPASEIEVVFADQTRRVSAGADGRWSVEFPPLDAGGDPRTMTVRSGGQRVEVKDILVGEVWLCSGQSNMEMGIWTMPDPLKEIAAANYPRIRLLQVPHKIVPAPANDVDSHWTPCTPEHVRRGGTSGLSAAAYFFGRELHQELKVPIGLIVSSYGGTPAQTWIAREALEADLALKPLVEQYDATIAHYDPAEAQAKYERRLADWKDQSEKAKAAGQPIPQQPGAPVHPGNSPYLPIGAFNGMIAPLTAYPIAGVIWYQGESNIYQPDNYQRLFTTLIQDWRQRWGRENLPFYFVQIAPYRYEADKTGQGCPKVWQAQLMTYRNVPHTGMVVTNDVGNVKDIHPKDKKTVGHRLALWALAQTYGRSDLVFSGPLYAGYEVKGDSIEVRFDPVGSGLASRDGKPLSHFQVASKDRQFHPAIAAIEGDKLIVRSDAVQDPVAVRFAWTDTAEPNLINKEGLPASPFRTDDW